ncbi:MAG: polyprenyl synthetase family protein, partial [Holophagales bacterium]|nr:polyprenyl synthetase family protein [Holophagales bacterium]
MLAPLPERTGPTTPPPAEPLRLVDAEALDQLRRELASALDPSGNLDPALAGVVRDTLDTPGSLWRPQLAWAIGRAHGLDAARALDLALGVECFHVASLLFDDLPAMDDSPQRRGRPAAHVVHGEGATILAALAFVHRGYRYVWAGFGDAPAEVRAEASERV